MNRPNLFSNSTLDVPNLISRLPLQRGFPVVLLALAVGLFALSPAALAVDPPPDGGYPNQNTAEGDGALFSLTTGSGNTAIGFHALSSNTEGDGNTATGAAALPHNTSTLANGH